MKALPREDYKRLRYAMFNYGIDSGIAYRIENYGDGLMMVTDAGHGQGRCLFFAVKEEDGIEVLTALLVYKKETAKVPSSVLESARRRMRGSS